MLQGLTKLFIVPLLLIVTMEPITHTHAGQFMKVGTEKWRQEFDKVFHITDDLFLVLKDGKEGLVNQKGEVILPIIYDRVGSMSNDHIHFNHIQIRKDSKVGYVNLKGEEVIPLTYRHATDFHETGLAIVSLDGKKYGLIDIDNKIILPMIYDEIKNYYSYLQIFEVRIGDKWGAVNTAGDIVIPIEYDKIGFFEKGFASIKKEDKIGLIDKYGNFVLPVKYQDITQTSGLIPVKINNKWGVVNENDETVINFEWEGMGSAFKDNLLVVRRQGKAGAINKEGRLVIPLEYDNIYGFYQGVSAVEMDGLWGFINKDNEIISPIQWDDFAYGRGSKKVIAVKKDYRFGFIDFEGNIVIKPEYLNFKLDNNGNPLVSMNDGWFYIGANGKPIPVLEHDK